MISARPRSALPFDVIVEESNQYHWIASAGDLVMVFVYEGSHQDLGHVFAAARLVERLHRRQRAPLRFLFLIPALHSKAPTSDVRTAIMEAARRLQSTVSRAALVVLGSGFGPALHRGAATGLIALARPTTTKWKISGSLREALGFLLDDDHPDLTQINARGEDELRAHAARQASAAVAAAEASGPSA